MPDPTDDRLAKHASHHEAKVEGRHDKPGNIRRHILNIHPDRQEDADEAVSQHQETGTEKK